MVVLIIGGGRVGSHLASLLLDLGHEVRVVENRNKVIDHLHRELPTEVVYVGDPMQAVVLRSAGIAEANVVVTAMGDDGLNLAIAYLAKQMFQIPRVISRVNNPKYAWLFQPEMGVDVALNQTDILSRLIEEEMSLGDMMPLLKLRRGQYSLVEEKIPAGAQAIDVLIKDLDLPDHCVIAAIIREGKVVVPQGTISLQEGDEVLAVVDRQAADHLADLFASPDSTSNKASGHNT
jgi:trk system potassium uptake protein TrkA